MHLDDGRVHLDRLDPDAHDLLALQLFKDAIQHTILGPAIHAGIDGVPVAEPLRQPAPLAAVLGYIQQRVEKLHIRQRNVAPLPGEAGRDAMVLRLGDLHELKSIMKSLLELVS